jgi:hypothetical protein
MKRMSAFALALGAAAFWAPAAVAQNDLTVDLMAPPFAGPPAPAIVTDDQALAALHQRGVAAVRRLGRVGDYWEGEGLLGGRPVLAYVFEDGATATRPAAPSDVRQALNVLPPASG